MDNTFFENRSHGTAVFPLQVYSHRDKNGFYFVSQHWHDEMEWIYVDNGVLNLTIRGHSCVMNPGTFCFVNSSELHEIRSTGDSYHHAIVFHPSLLDFALHDTCQHNFIGPLTRRKLLFPSFSVQLSPSHQRDVLSHMHAIVELYHSQPAYQALSIKIHLLSVLEILFRANCFQANTATLKGDDSLSKLKKVIGYVEKNYASPISLAELAEIAFMSPNYFCHYFRREIGKSPIVFVNEYRIQQAARLLSESDLPISQIALDVGFDNFSYFIRKFREYRHITPTAYRKIWRQGS